MNEREHLPTILVDADGCPVKQIIETQAKARKLPVLFFIDSCHVLSPAYGQVVQVDKGADSADFVLVNRCKKGDVVITGDYGVATMALARNCQVLGFSGLVYTSQNIDQLLFQRHLCKKARRAGARPGHIKKRTDADDAAFAQSLSQILDQICPKEEQQ
jgi:uncharacterized protein YaiI (UPF0178 family)